MSSETKRQSLAVWISQQRSVPYKTRRSLIKRIYPQMLRNFPFEAEFYDLRFRGNIVNYIDRLIYFCGAHEKYMLSLMRDYVSRLRHQQPGAMTFVDVGANAGNHTLFMARIVEEVHAFEPFERVRKQLEDNLALNRITNVRVHPFGLSNENKTLPFYAGPESNLGASSFQPTHKHDNIYLGDMDLKRGDEVIATSGIGRVDIIKADVEGYEKFVLEGLSATLKRDRPLAIIELSPTTRDTLGGVEGLSKLFPADYRFYYFAAANPNTGRYRLAPFDYSRESKIQDVIACPDEKLSCLTRV